jgi:hypothetical protein
MTYTGDEKSGLQETSLEVRFRLDDVKNDWFFDTIYNDVYENLMERAENSTNYTLEKLYFQVAPHTFDLSPNRVFSWAIQDLASKDIGVFSDLQEFYEALICREDKRKMILELKDLLM